MTIPALLGQNSQVATGGSIAVTCTVPPGGAYLEVYGTTGGPTTQFSSCADNSGAGVTYALQSSAEDTTNTQSLGRYISSKAVPAGSWTFTLTFANATCGDIAVAVVALPGSPGQIASCAANFQTAPGTGTGAVTTGLSGTLPSKPAVLTAMTLCTHGTAAITAAGGATQFGGAVWGTIKANFGFLEYLPLTATTSVAGTFTNATSGNAQVSVGGVWAVSSFIAAVRKINPLLRM